MSNVPPAAASTAASTVSPSGTPRLIALDWGTSNLRASLLGDAGTVLATCARPGGVMAVQNGQFEAALVDCCGAWLNTWRVPLIASGMIGSRQGWREAPYLPCPARLDAAASQLLAVPLRSGHTLFIVPGLQVLGSDDAFDVMRGEETQLWGADLPAGSLCVLPGTHAKWAWTGAAGTIDTFRTYMTGELFGLLTQHGILGRLMEFGQADTAAFAAGVQRGLAEHAHLSHAIFAARTAGLMNRIVPAGLPDFLSGMLIGAEIASATRAASTMQAPRPTQVTLLGDDGLCARYGAALDLTGIAHRRAPDQATTRGQWRVAQCAGLVGASTATSA